METCAEFLDSLCAGRDMTAAEAARATEAIFNGDWSEAQMAGFLIALKAKGETPIEIAAAAQVMRARAVPVAASFPPESLCDIVGTGGDGARTFNVSTAAAFVACAAGAKIAKHGNRALSSASGAADVLAELGLDLSLPPTAIGALIDEVGFGFLFAPAHHAAMRHVMPARKALAVRTIFNLLGPLSNPAGAGRLVVGVYSPALIDPFARALAAMGAKQALVVGGDGVDEIALDGETSAARLRDGEIERFSIRPADWGATPAPLAAVRVDSPAESKQMLLAALAGENPIARDFAAVNAGALLTVADIAPDLKAGFELARATIASGAARAKVDSFLAAATRAR